MSAHRILESIDKSQRRQQTLPEFRPGDSIKVWAKIREGEKTRLQAFEGVCIRRSAKGARSTFTVRKISYGVGVERVFPDNSPNIDKIEVIQRGKVNQSKLYYLRDLSGKAARIKEREGSNDNRGKDKEAAEAPVEAEAAAPADDAAAAPAAAPVEKKKRKERKKEKK
ncbi:MAG: 50S ribosomal protein L19 [Deltaproteobacteria bacterium]|nr:50S ribosomal protein L19 [Deltaproteobacteria bacterium]